MHEASKIVLQEELLNLLLLHLPLKQAAVRLNVSYQTVRKYASEPDFLNNLRVLSQSIYEEVIIDLKTEKKSLAERLTDASEIALEKLKILIESEQEGIALKACDSILDRTVETARNRKDTLDAFHRFTIDPVTLMHAALTSQELINTQNPNVLVEKDATKTLPEKTQDAS